MDGRPHSEGSSDRLLSMRDRTAHYEIALIHDSGPLYVAHVTNEKFIAAIGVVVDTFSS